MHHAAQQLYTERIMRLVHAQHLAHAGSCMHTTEHTQLTEFDDEHGHQRDEREQHSEKAGSHPAMSQIDAPPSAAAELAAMITARISAGHATVDESLRELSWRPGFTGTWASCG